MIDPRLRNRTVLVTGANNPYGIGAAIALAFAQVGAKLALHYFRSPGTPTSSDVPGDEFYRAQQVQDCEAVIRRVEAAGGDARAFEGDFNRLSDIPDLSPRSSSRTATSTC